jgi:hypothetical protein
VLVAGSLLLTGTAAAEDQAKACDPSDSKDCIEHVIQGTRAPFTGMLVGPRRSAVMTVKSQQCDARTKAAVREATELGEVKLQAEKDRRANDSDTNKQKIIIMRQGMEAYKQRFGPKWYKHPALWFSIGVVAAAGVMAASVAIIDKTRPSVVTAE